MQKFNKNLQSDYNIIFNIAKDVRKYITNKYGTGNKLCGHCIEASDIILEKLKEQGFEATSPEGYILLNKNLDWQYPYDEHVWVECNGYFIDVTIEQFNEWLRDEDQKFPPICIFKKRPDCLTLKKPILYDDKDEYNLYLAYEFNTKFNTLYNKIISEMREMTFEDTEDKKVFDFSVTDIGQFAIAQIQRSFNHMLKEYKEKFPIFKNVKLEFDSFDDLEQTGDIFGEVFPEDPTTIRINMFPILQQVYYADLKYKDPTETLNILDDLLDQLDDGTYPNLQGPLIAHELAHILDMSEDYNMLEPHNKNWENKLNFLLTKK